jgi:hypothetical protein
MLVFFKRIFFVLSIFCFALNLTFAQVPDILIKTSNENPREGETVKFTLDSDKYNLSNAKITWYVDGNEMDQGVGRRTFSVVMTNQNPVQVVVVSVEENGLEGSQAQKIIEISGDILLYEGYNSVTPLFYKGRSLPGREGAANVQILSFKDGEITSFGPSVQGSFNYIWRVNGEEKKELGGINKSQNILNSRVVDNNLRVEILKQNENSGKNLSLNVPLQTTEALLKKISDNWLIKTNLQESERGKQLLIDVEPLFFSVKSKYSPDLKYTWKINNLESSVPNPWQILFTGDNKEVVKVNLYLKNSKKIIQDTSKSFTFKVE